MALIGETRYLERLQFFNGQRLFASDLQAIEAFNREMRWLHNQSLHQPGVGSGYAVSGNRGDREVIVSAGYAINAMGQEIVLTERRVEPIPPVADDGEGRPVLYDLTVSYPDDSRLEEVETREGICRTRGAVRLKEEPVFCWVRLDANGQPSDPDLKAQVLSGMKILLARAEIFNCQLNKPLSTAQRRNARPGCLPFMACGEAGGNPDDWRVFSYRNGLVNGLEIDVDTSSAGFRTTPCYSAHIVGGRLFEQNIRGQESVRTIAFLLDGFVSVFDARPEQFTLRVLMPQAQVGDLVLNPSEFFSKFDENKALIQKNGWRVSWMGIGG
ncbi:MAG: hypothetical protein L0229_02515 [Blastocatellia bacterium]|nr:hypothetical protein [Blastocatellia bacterium]